MIGIRIRARTLAALAALVTGAALAQAPAWLDHDEADGLREGRGMGLATAAEVNRLPGPLHVLELADALALDDAQREATEALRAAMLRDARALGADILAREAALDAALARADADAVRALSIEIGRLRGELRAVHLITHLSQRTLLSSEQTERYFQHRARSPSTHGHGHGHAHR